MKELFDVLMITPPGMFIDADIIAKDLNISVHTLHFRFITLKKLGWKLYQKTTKKDTSIPIEGRLAYRLDIGQANLLDTYFSLDDISVLQCTPEAVLAAIVKRRWKY